MVSVLVSPQEKIERIFKILERGPHSMTKLAKLAKMHHETAMKYVDMAIYVQNQPKIEKVVSERTILVRIQQD